MFAVLRLVVVICGCLAIFGIVFSTISAQFLRGKKEAPQVISLTTRRAGRRGRGGKAERCNEPVGASYSRYSSDLQDEDTIVSQQRRCHERAAREGDQIQTELEFSDEAVSGTKLHREGFDAMLAAARQGKFRTLYLYNLSRLGRESVITMPVLKELVYVHKVRVISATEPLDTNQEGWELMATILAFQHERYVKDLSHNVFRGQESAILAGFSAGDYCFGYSSEPVPGTERGRKGKPRMKYTIDTEEVEWVRRIFHWFVVDRQTIRWITRELNRLVVSKGRRSKTKKWRHSNVISLLRNGKYIGIWPWGTNKNVRNPLTGQVSQEERPEEEREKWVRQFSELQVIERETFVKAQQILDENAERYAGRRRSDGTLKGIPGKAPGRSPKHLLAGLIVCGECGATFSVGGSGGKYFFCPNYAHGACTCKTQLRQDRAEKMILHEIGGRILANPNWRQAVLEALQHAWDEQEATVPVELAQAEQQLAETERKIQRLVDRAENEDDDPELTARLRQRRAEKADLRKLVDRLRNATAKRTAPPIPEWVDEQLTKLHKTLSQSTPAAAYALRDLLGGKIVVQEIRREGHQRHHLRGTVTIQCGNLARTLATDDSHSVNNSEEKLLTEDIVINFVDPNPLEAISEEAKRLYDAGLMNAEIAVRLGKKRGFVTKVLKLWFESRGLEMPDGRSRRSQLQQKHMELQLYQKIADDAKSLFDQDLLYHEIAEKLSCDMATVLSALRHWHRCRGLELPDGRTRRKSLTRKTATKQNSDESNDVDRPAA